MGPVFCHTINLSVSQISYFMKTTVLGGLLIQWPIGALSDRFDRSLVIPVISAALSLICGLMIFATQGTFNIFIAAAGLFGGFLFCIYPVSVARAHDLFEPKDVINVSSALLLFYGIGAVIGPVSASAAMELINSPYAFYIYFSVASALWAAFSFFLRQKELTQRIPVEEQVDFIIMDHTSQVAIQIDPRSELDQITESTEKNTP